MNPVGVCGEGGREGMEGGRGREGGREGGTEGREGGRDGGKGGREERREGGREEGKEGGGREGGRDGGREGGREGEQSLCEVRERSIVHCSVMGYAADIPSGMYSARVLMMLSGFNPWCRDGSTSSS